MRRALRQSGQQGIRRIPAAGQYPTRSAACQHGCFADGLVLVLPKEIFHDRDHAHVCSANKATSNQPPATTGRVHAAIGMAGQGTGSAGPTLPNAHISTSSARTIWGGTR
eukprot:363378-Chlamydomonas_euryale.AAC.38